MTRLLNFLCMNRVAQDSKELGAYLKLHKEHIPFVSNFILTKKICTLTDQFKENQSSLQACSFCFKCVGLEEFMSCLIQECVDAFLKILSKNIKFYDATNLSPIKNIAYFLGHLTLFNNRPLLASELDLKQFICEGYMKSEARPELFGIIIMIVVKILHSCSPHPIYKEIIFCKRNPWVSQILNLLSESYFAFQNGERYFQNTYINVKFEIEIVFRQFEEQLSFKGKGLLSEFKEYINGNEEALSFEGKYILDRIRSYPYI